MTSFEFPSLDGLPTRPRTIEGAVGDGPSVVSGKENGSEGFASHLVDAVQEVQDLQDDVKGKAEAMARGEPVELHDLMIAMGKSDVAFNMMLEVRNKLVDAWQTLSRTT